MSDKLIPANTQLAAKRGFIRTTSQALATTIPTAGVTGAALSGMDWRAVAWAIAAAVLSSLAAGAVSGLSILSKGIPEDYAPEIPPRDAETGEVEAIEREHDGTPGLLPDLPESAYPTGAAPLGDQASPHEPGAHRDDDGDGIADAAGPARSQ